MVVATVSPRGIEVMLNSDPDLLEDPKKFLASMPPEVIVLFNSRETGLVLASAETIKGLH